MFRSWLPTPPTLCTAVLPPQPIYFKLTQDTPANQGYVTAKPLIWLQAENKYDVVEDANEIKIYDRIDTITYTGTQYRGPSNWTKKDSRMLWRWPQHLRPVCSRPSAATTRTWPCTMP